MPHQGNIRPNLDISGPSFCPSCGGDHVQSLAMVFASGTSRSIFSGLGLGLGTGGGMGGFVGSGRSTSLLASQAAPPAEKRLGFPTALAVGFFFAALIFFGFYSNDMNSGLAYDTAQATQMMGIALGFLAAMVVSAVFAIRAAIWNTREWPKLFLAWSSYWMCLKCGSVLSRMPQS